LPLRLLTVSIVVEEVAMLADLFRTIALDVMDVNRTEVDVVGSKQEGEEDKKKLLLMVMMPQLMMLMVLPLTMLMVLPLTMLMVLPPLTRDPVLTMMNMEVAQPQMMRMVLQLRNMVPQLMMLMVLPLTMLMVHPLTMLMVHPPLTRDLVLHLMTIAMMTTLLKFL